MVYKGEGAYVEEYAPDLPPGFHRCRLVRRIELNGGANLAIFAADLGEVAVYISDDIAPRKKGEKGGSFQFWQIVARSSSRDGFVGYPAGYWTKKPEDRGSRTWDPDRDLDAMIREGYECVIQCEYRWDRKKNRNRISAEQIIRIEKDPYNLPPGGSHLIEEQRPPEDEGSDDGYDGGNEVPF